MQSYHAMMVDLAVQLVQKWERLNADESVDVPADMTRLALDVIGLCGFSYRFNSFYRDRPHPFVVSLDRALNAAITRVRRPDLMNRLAFGLNRQLDHDMQVMFSMVDRIIAERRSGESADAVDLLAHMLNDRDPETGETLDDENIRYQIITFLIAGHETTGAMLSFAQYFLLKHPDVLAKAQEEVDRVLTDPLPTYQQVRNLRYVRMILQEALRLWPTVPGFSLYAKEDTLLGGKYPMKKGATLMVLVPKLHRDTSVWGEDAEEFRPERFEGLASLPPHAYKPFGSGQRACIGQQFALHEATLALGMVLRQFELIDHTNYQLKVHETLTRKPEGFTVRIRPRREPLGVSVAAAPTAQTTLELDLAAVAAGRPAPAAGTPLLVLYGSNLGTAEGIARDLADAARFQGFVAELAPLDERIGKLPTQGAVFIVTASYNGTPPDNARGFVNWLEAARPGELAGVRYAVFGCGDRNWASTYQRIPRQIDEQFAAKGATRLAERGEGDASEDFEAQLSQWRGQLWPRVTSALGLALNEQVERERGSLSVEFVGGPVAIPLVATYGALSATIAENRELQGAGSGRSTRHLEVALPEGAAYREGDHLGVLARNPAPLVERALRRFGLSGTEHLVLSGSGLSDAHLPLERPIAIRDLLGLCVELQEPATRAQLHALIAHTTCPPHRRELEALVQEEVYRGEVLAKRVSMLDLLEQYPACELPFERLLELLPPLKPRYYSISSSPLTQPDRACITVGVVRGPAHSGRGEYLGVASNFLAERQPGEEIVMFIRNPQSGFELPEDPATPMIMVGPGTGVAPFRGFLQARRAQQAAGHTLGPAHLYFGCRHPDHDYLYRDELESAERDGLVTLHTAFSRIANQPVTYVQDLIRQEAAELIDLLEGGARLYVCGDGRRMAPAVEATFRAAYENARGVSEPAAQAWLDGLLAERRYTKDVWTGE
jgi:cytochrome P450/NADPH-cytochrome P450 reductase